MCFCGCSQDPAGLAPKIDPSFYEHLHAAWNGVRDENMPVEGAPVQAPTAVN